ncbi:hypothetical protein MNBD_GAMMA26-1976 [hydrothermal vent metagenome]|uniref:Uncharacterized protein n=1 Tax=hydrothermal vent metagenome TaxID=652676 RepID=A0A3B1AT48_9ZZZZ
MKRDILRCLITSMILFSCVSLLSAEPEKVLPKGMTPAKLEKSVNRQLKYIDKRLLSGKGAKEINSSGNENAIAILKESKAARDKIAEQISKGEFEDSYWALKDLGNSLRAAMKMVRAKGTTAKKTKDELESAQIASDAYTERARQRGVHDGSGGSDAQSLFKRAEQKRAEAQQLKAAKDYKVATVAFLKSSELLKKAIATSKQQGYSSSAVNSTVEEKRTLPKGMTPEKLQKSVIRQHKYITTRLLSEKSEQKIKDSQNSKAMQIFERGQARANSISSKIDNQQYEKAYWALRDLAASMKEAMKLARSKERKDKQYQDEMESAHAISDAYHERAKQKGIQDGSGGRAALGLFKRANTERTDAEDSRANKDYKCAIKAYQLSAEFLKKSIAIKRKWRGEEKE